MSPEHIGNRSSWVEVSYQMGGEGGVEPPQSKVLRTYCLAMESKIILAAMRFQSQIGN